MNRMNRMNPTDPKNSPNPQPQRSPYLGALVAISVFALSSALGGCVGEPSEADPSVPSDPSDPSDPSAHTSPSQHQAQARPQARPQPHPQDQSHAQAIKATFRRKRKELKACYDLARRQQPNLNTKITLKLSLSRDGQVSAPSILKATVGSKILEGCLLDTVSKWTFPSHPGGEKSVVTYPLTFSTGQTAGVENSLQKTPSSSGAQLDSQSIRRVWNHAKKSFLVCYEAALKENPTLKGRIKVEFTIDESGRVSRAKAVQVALDDEAVVKCVVDHVATLTFPKPSKGSVEVAMPLTFTP